MDYALVYRLLDIRRDECGCLGVGVVHARARVELAAGRARDCRGAYHYSRDNGVERNGRSAVAYSVPGAQQEQLWVLVELLLSYQSCYLEYVLVRNPDIHWERVRVSGAYLCLAAKRLVLTAHEDAQGYLAVSGAPAQRSARECAYHNGRHDVLLPVLAYSGAQSNFISLPYLTYICSSRS